MARDIGAWLVSRGKSVTWVGTDPERRAGLEALGRKAIRRLERSDPSRAAPVRAAAAAPEELRGCARLVIETTTEHPVTKQAAIAAAHGGIGPDTVLVSNSSSILPAAIDPRCVGMHFFAPVALSEFVELIVERDRPPHLRDAARGAAESLGLEYVVEDERSAFAANRMLLGVQNEAARALSEGAPVHQVNECSRVAGMPIGVLELIERVGRPTIAAALAQYRSRMPAAGAAELEPFARILGGSAPPAARNEMDDGALRTRMRCALAGASVRFEADGLLCRADIDRLWCSARGTELSLSRMLTGTGTGTLREQTRRLYEQTGLSYFEPLGPLA
jgi:3-hydroxybutyryl-CoA dehydrogenase